MGQSLSKIFVHSIFSTKNRYPFLHNKNIRNEMHSYLGGACNKLECPVLIVGGVSDHVHIVYMLKRTMTNADLIGEIKRESSKWIKKKGLMLSKFSWQNGYGSFSIGLSEIERIKNYIKGQEEHHKKVTFQEEYLEHLNAYGVDYDERYVWD